MPHIPLVVQLVIALLVLGITGASGVVATGVVIPRIVASPRLAWIAARPRSYIAIVVAFLFILVVLFLGGMALGYWVIPPSLFTGS